MGSIEETVTVFVVENRLGGKLLSEQSVLPRLLFPIIQVTYKMERQCTRCLEMASKLAEVILQHEKWNLFSGHTSSR